MHMPMEEHEYREESEHGRTEVYEDKALQRENQIRKINGIIWLLFGILEAVIGLRVILKVLAANPDNPFASFIYQISYPFLSPFFGLVGEPTADGSVLEVTSIIAMVVYALIGWGITYLVALIMTPSEVRHVSTTRRH